MTTVFIKGLGLIGSSLARAILKAHPDTKIIANDRDDKTLDFALTHGLIQEKAHDLSSAAQADVIILATPVTIILQDLAKLARLPLKEHVIVTDVGSTKQAVAKAAQPLTRKGIVFIGGHPMAGSHKSGVTAGRDDLFENAFYFLMKTDAPESDYQRLEKLFAAAKVKWLRLSSDEHDQLVGQISHLPHIIAAALVNQTQNAFAHSPLGMRMAAGGFKSITRIASSDPTMWTSILQSNASTISQQMTDYLLVLQRVQSAIDQQDWDTIFNFFQSAKISRDALGPETIGQLPNFFDLFVSIPDKVGSIASVAQLLAEHQINLVNLHILEIREEIDGVLQLTFMRDSDRQRARQLLSEKKYLILQKNS